MKSFLFLLLLFPVLAVAGVVATAKGVDGVRVTLYDEPCALVEVSNLPLRAQWVEGEKTFEGCWSGSRLLPLIMTYWSDKTVVAIPLSGFTAVHGT